MLIHLLIAAVTLMHESSSCQLVVRFCKFLFRKGAFSVPWIFFVGSYSPSTRIFATWPEAGKSSPSLSASRYGAGMHNLRVAAGVVFFGLKAIGVQRDVRVIALLVCVGSFRSRRSEAILPEFAMKGTMKGGSLSSAGEFRLLGAFFVRRPSKGSLEPQAGAGAVMLGMGINLFFTLVFFRLGDGISTG